MIFLSTLSLRRATVGAPEGADTGNISIHALLAESDRVLDGSKSSIEDFYPRSPCGERRRGGDSCYLDNIDFYPRSPCGERQMSGATRRILRAFLSTLSLRRATWLRCWQLAARDISIHALLAESDRIHRQFPCQSPEFLSTLSLRRATFVLVYGS